MTKSLSTAQVASNLQFSFQECIREIKAIEGIVKRGGYIDENTAFVLPQLIEKLEGIRDFVSDGMIKEWGIPKTYPLRTKISLGQYERTGGGSHRVFGELTSIWQIKPLGHQKAPGRMFTLAGKASTCVRLIDSDDNSKQLAMWRMEIAADDHPGCYFHTQVLGESTDGPFPKSISVPRFPSLLPTPANVLEYVLGELFQNEWPMEVGKDNDDVRAWNSIQRSRLDKFLNWQLNAVRGSTGSPWVVLKMLKPGPRLLL